MPEKPFELGDRIKAALIKSSSVIGTEVVGFVTTIKDGRIFVTDDIYGREFEIDPSKVLLIKKAEKNYMKG